MHGLEIIAFLPALFALGAILYALSLLSRLVKSNERIAAAVEEVALKCRRDDR
jgi:hypothetical protein